jgi:hypothetical protein
MRDFRDAKSMAQTLREALAAKHHKITVGESLELIARLFGVADWNTLSALIKDSDPGAKTTGVSGRSGGLEFTPTTKAALHRAVGAAQERGQTEVTVEHLLLALTEDPDATATMETCAVDPAIVRKLLSSSGELGSVSDRGEGAEEFSGPSPAFQRVVRRAILDAAASGRENITGTHLLAAILAEPEGAAVRIVQEHAPGLSAAVKNAGRRTG